MNTTVKDMRFPPSRLPSGGPVYFWPVFDPGSTGVNGDPTLATAEKGKALLDAITKNLVEFIRTFHKTPMP
jgi:creatinine amidohydrolase/Fe(II)-dependent formamide hydrolase-like protein